uniref:Uncharacterized protein n=1 Tax=Chromera velia CCMP2878 TaxID=1169474 RepID=A0A0G4I1Y8_9ALVE|eukprot:Cvel_10272.t1-p1 / transcript=Cvel_10272.t1 / gene=Cvel_10272 / organism=Chromera_velia_CCMP2878 / gene_product=hypothetical protein / transcript_product=hypothetical protein / location=Cvel_scaffold616:35857-36330(+) / protein_length=158 / sequence_SO=supercontig / SO=protein_coding / is_pseudo=false
MSVQYLVFVHHPFLGKTGGEIVSGLLLGSLTGLIACGALRVSQRAPLLVSVSSVCAGIYFGFAMLSTGVTVLIQESLVTAFFIVAGATKGIEGIKSACGLLLLHAVYDLCIWAGVLPVCAHAPPQWPLFCAAYDVALSILLAPVFTKTAQPLPRGKKS